MELKKIWIVEEGEYEQHGPVLVATSPEAALEGLKVQHEKWKSEYIGNPNVNGYEVRWGGLRAVTTRPSCGPEFEVTAYYRASESLYEIREIDFAEGAAEGSKKESH